MTIEEIIKTCKERNELDFLFDLTKIVAESDSIGEEYNYCDYYTIDQFNNAEKHIRPAELKARGYKDEYDSYLKYAGVKLYERYLKQIKC